MRGFAAAARRGWAALSAPAFAAAAAFACGPALAQGAQAPLAITVTVPRHTSLRVAQPDSLVVSEEDLARGWIDIARPIEVIVQSNARQGYTLAFERQGGSVREVQVQGLGEPLLVLGGATLASRPAAGQGLWRELLTLRYRFVLAPDARAGRHKWPVRISLIAQ